MIFALLMAEPALRPAGALRAARPMVARPAGPRGLTAFLDQHTALARADARRPAEPATAERLKPAA